MPDELLCIDTNVMIWGILQNGKSDNEKRMIEKAACFFESGFQKNKLFAISIITFSELMTGIPPEERDPYIDLISRNFVLLPFSEDAALKAADIIPKQDRAFRDLVCLRVDLVQDRARYRTVLKNFFNNQRYMKITTARLNRMAEQYCNGDATELYSLFDNDNTCLKAGHYLTAMHHLNLQIQQLEEQIKAQEIKNDLTCHRYLPRLYSMKGCGFILGSIIATEIVNINRFRTEKDFVSYCRLSPAVRLSNEKKKGDGNRKNGNAYLSWAMTELANLMVFHNPVIKKKYDRQLKKCHLRAKAIRSIAAKLARCIWHMLKKDKDFQIEQAFK